MCFIFKINLKTANDKKKFNSNNEFMFVINNPKGTHLWLFSKKFSKKYFSSVGVIPLNMGTSRKEHMGKYVNRK